MRQIGDFPVKHKATAKWAILAVCRWSGLPAATIPFTASSFRALLAGMSPGKAGIAKKTLHNAKSAIEAVLRFYGLERSTLASVPLTAELDQWFARLSRYEKAGTGRFFRFLSARRRTIGDVSDADSQAYLATLEAEYPARVARAKHQDALRTWNGLAGSYPDWQGKQLSRPLLRVPWALSWKAFPPELEATVDALFAARAVGSNLFADKPVGIHLKPTTVRNRKEHLRVAASILCTHCGLRPGKLISLQDLCRPDRFKSAIGAVVERSEGKVTAYVEQIAITLLQAARECHALSDTEIAEVENLRRSVYRRGLADRKFDVSPDQQILDELDDPERMDALLSLPTRTVLRAHREGVVGRTTALRVEMALALEVWFAAPLRITNLVTLRLDEHVQHVRIGRTSRVVIRVPGIQTKNGQPLEHFLHEAAAELLELYLQTYRPVLAAQDSPWLFPGRGGGHKHSAVLARQVKAYVWEGTGIRFHPHLIRKVATKIILDEDPSAIEVARVTLGHEDTRTTRSAYVQAQSRAAQAVYLDAMQRRRLAAVGPLPSRLTTLAPKPLRVGKGRHIGRVGA